MNVYLSSNLLSPIYHCSKNWHQCIIYSFHSEACTILIFQEGESEGKPTMLLLAVQEIRKH